MPFLTRPSLSPLSFGPHLLLQRLATVLRLSGGVLSWSASKSSTSERAEARSLALRGVSSSAEASSEGVVWSPHVAGERGGSAEGGCAAGGSAADSARSAAAGAVDDAVSAATAAAAGATSPVASTETGADESGSSASSSRSVCDAVSGGHAGARSTAILAGLVATGEQPSSSRSESIPLFLPMLPPRPPRQGQVTAPRRLVQPPDTDTARGKMCCERAPPMFNFVSLSGFSNFRCRSRECSNAHENFCLHVYIYMYMYWYW